MIKNLEKKQIRQDYETFKQCKVITEFKTYFKEGIKQYEEESEKRFMKIKSSIQKFCDNHIVVVNNLKSYMQNTEQNLKYMSSFLRNSN